MIIYIDEKGNTNYIDTLEKDIRVVGDFTADTIFKVSLELPTGRVTQEKEMIFEDNSWLYLLEESDKAHKGIIKYQVRAYRNNQIISTNRGLIPNY